ncbi:MAG: hypothetical protein JNL08_00650 [Planctomycetes bacterium]|nr:hypothetical protein [Planctomycetota bacterium]
MQTHAILELDEGALTLTLGGRVGKTTTVAACHRQPLADWSRDSVTAALQPLALDLLQDVDGVHVVLGDRRMQHFVQVLPQMPAREVEEFVGREALRLTSMPAVGEVLASVRLVRRLPGKLVVGGSALPRSVWEPVRQAIQACGVAVHGVHSTESCLALAVPAGTEDRYAVVECAGGRARFALCDGGSPVQVRRFMVGTAESNPEALAAQLALELPRTLEWLRETGHQPPSVLVLGNRISVDEATLDTIRGDLARVVLPSLVGEASRGFEAPSLASTALLEKVAAGRTPAALSAAPRLVLPPSPLRMLWLAAAIAVGGAFLWHGARDLTVSATTAQQLAEVGREHEVLRQRLVELTGTDNGALANEDAARMTLALGRRRPISRLVAEVSEAAAADVLLDSLQFASKERVVVSGVVRGTSRAAALALLAEFASRLGGLPYLDGGGQEDVGEVAGMPNHFRFRLGLAWRMS